MPGCRYRMRSRSRVRDGCAVYLMSSHSIVIYWRTETLTKTCLPANHDACWIHSAPSAIPFCIYEIVCKHRLTTACGHRGPVTCTGLCFTVPNSWPVYDTGGTRVPLVRSARNRRWPWLACRSRADQVYFIRIITFAIRLNYSIHVHL